MTPEPARPLARPDGAAIVAARPGAMPDGAGPSASGESAVITVRGLRMSYGHYEAVRGIDLDVARGEILAFLGPNGAGKTTGAR
jgi:ABC-type glutathione transport system ATPase component